jgi:hypothetical protein
MTDLTWRELGIELPRMLLPKTSADMTKWAVVACDQYTSEPEYWKRVDERVGDAPSTLRLILPEALLSEDSKENADREAGIIRAMEAYLKGGVFRTLPKGAILVRRYLPCGVRTGLVLAFDLDRYDYKQGSASLIRATEGTVEERVQARLSLRRRALIELPHILMLIDDPKKTVIEPLAGRAKTPEYDFELMEHGGRITGEFLSEEDLEGARLALSALAKEQSGRFGKPLLLYAMGDGNHSLAAAKAVWEEVKPSLTEEERQDHPLRFALCELVNVHDDGILFEPIHRLLTGVNPGAINEIAYILAEQNGDVSIGPAGAKGPEFAHVLPYVSKEEQGAITVPAPVSRLAVATLQNALEVYVKRTGAKLDYIHGDETLEKLASRDGALGFLFPAMEKADLFATVILEGALPKKTFSMGEAQEKRYYLEARSLR